MNLTGSILAIDYGDKRIGLALASATALLAKPLKTINNDNNLVNELKSIIKNENVRQIIVGLPKNLNNEVTNQTKIVQQFAANLKDELNLPITYKEEALTSVKAEAELTSRKGKIKKSDIDALAATYILEDWINEDYLPSQRS